MLSHRREQVLAPGAKLTCGGVCIPVMVIKMKGSWRMKRSRLRLFKTFVAKLVLIVGLYVGVGVIVIGAQPGNPTPAGWEKYSGNPVLGGKYGTCFDISVLKEGDGYRMWFSWRPKASVALVESEDGFHWSTPVIVLSPNKASGWEDDINRPVVIKQGGVYRMWYTGQWKEDSAIGYATSADGITWKRESD